MFEVLTAAIVGYVTQFLLSAVGLYKSNEVFGV